MFNMYWYFISYIPVNLFLQYNKPGKKWKVMTQEFINQHTVEHKGKQICKYFLEGRCIKVSVTIKSMIEHSNFQSNI